MIVKVTVFPESVLLVGVQGSDGFVVAIQQGLCVIVVCFCCCDELL